MMHPANWKYLAKRVMLLAVLLATPKSTSAAITINAASPSLADVTVAVASAADGDTVVVPPGTASWTSTLTITKAITLLGATTTDTTTNTSSDQTIILDNVPRPDAPFLTISVVSGQPFRLSGFTFEGGTVTTRNSNGGLRLSGTCHSLRVDHCHFLNLYEDQYIQTFGWIYGVIDHCIFDFGPGTPQSVNVWMDAYNGGTYGEGSWEDATNFGSEKFVFIEDNCINNPTTIETVGIIDALRGGRYVLRHNHLYNIEAGGHGTETLRDRGVRAVEIYDNDFHWTVSKNVGQMRSGVIITHDNTWAGAPLGGGMQLQSYRTFAGIGPWNGAYGANGWDVNDTEGNGTNVPGHTPFLYDSGTVTSASLAGTMQTITDSTKSWTTNQWAGYSLQNMTNLSGGATGFIQSNTNNTLTCYYYTDSGGGTVFSAGDGYQIHSVLIALDQPGRGRCTDVISGTSPLNATAGNIVAWPHQTLEPCYSWNDLCNGAEVDLRPGIGPRTIQANRDYYNNTPMPGYTPYTYPHPLVTSGGHGPQTPGDLHIMH